MNTRHLLAAAALAACSTLAQAASVGPYVGASAGVTSFNVDCSPGVSCDDSATGYKLYAGYNFDHQFGVEVDYLDFGNATWSVSGIKALDLSATAVGAAGVFNFDINRQWSGAVKLGLAQVSLDGTGPYGNGSQSDTKLYGGIDFAYAVSPQLKLRGGWDFTTGDYTDRFGYGMSGGVHLFSLGASYSF